ncbi:Hypothetical predicted protein, partial [Pelobates cultripes]
VPIRNLLKGNQRSGRLRPAEVSSESSLEREVLYGFFEEDKEVEYFKKSIDSRSIDKLIVAVRDTLKILKERAEIKIQTSKSNKTYFSLRTTIKELILNEWSIPEKRLSLKGKLPRVCLFDSKESRN